MKNLCSVLCLILYWLTPTFPVNAVAGELSRHFFEPSRITQAKIAIRYTTLSFSKRLLKNQTHRSQTRLPKAGDDLSPPRQPNLGFPILGAVAGGGLGIVAGGGVALAAVGVLGCDEEDCGLEWLFWGTVTGDAVLLPLGTHLGNKRQGNFLLDLVVSSAIAFGGMALTFETNSAAVFVATPFLQVISTVAVERLIGGK
ncbi:MAG: hypothetical protein ACE5IR_17890 [bacterium]